MLAGLSLIIASSCVFNNYIDRDIDEMMERTKNRASVRGLVSARNSTIYASVLGALGVAILTLFTNSLALETPPPGQTLSDLAQFEAALTKEGCTYRVFTTNVSIRGAKWSRAQTK